MRRSGCSAYNRSVPGPVITVRQGCEILVDVLNHGDLEATVHWHGLRLDNRYDGTHETQDPIRVGERFEYRLQFPDPGVYWYHPHIREDYGQEMGLYGNILVVPTDPEYWPPAHREVLLTLDDVLLEGGRIAPFDPDHTTYSAMGRFGNLLLVGGEPEISMSARPGEVVRFYLTNTANTRVFNVVLRGARMKLVGGDSGRCEHEQLVESVILAPSERVVVDVLFDAEGQAALEHITPERTYHLGSVEVGGEPADTAPTEAFGRLRTNPEMVAERERARRVPRRGARQDDRAGGGDGLRGAGGRGRLPVSDAPGGRLRRGRQVPAVRHEADAHAGGPRLRLPDAPRRRRRAAGQVPAVRHEAHACGRRHRLRLPHAP